MFLALMSCLRRRKGVEVKELPVATPRKWKVGLKNRVCQPHKLITVTQIVIKNLEVT